MKTILSPSDLPGYNWRWDIAMAHVRSQNVYDHIDGEFAAWNSKFDRIAREELFRLYCGPLKGALSFRQADEIESVIARVFMAQIVALRDNRA